MDIPIIRIELERVRESVSHMIADHNGELNQMIIDTLDKTLTEEWVQHKINQSVKECLNKAIEGLADNYHLRDSLTRALVNYLYSVIEPQEESK